MQTQTIETRQAKDVGWLLRASVPSSIIAALLSALVLAVRLAQIFLDYTTAGWQEVALGWLTVVGGGLGAISTAAMLYRWSLILRRRQAFRLGEEMKDQASNLPDYAQNVLQQMSQETTKAVKQQVQGIGGRVGSIGGRMGSIGAQVTQTVAVAVVAATLIPATAVGGAPVLLASTLPKPAPTAFPTRIPFATPTPIPVLPDLQVADPINLNGGPCGQGPVQVAVTNTGQGTVGNSLVPAPITVRWSTEVRVGGTNTDFTSATPDPRYQASPASGSLAPGATVIITLSGPFPDSLGQYIQLGLYAYASEDPTAQPYDAWVSWVICQ